MRLFKWFIKRKLDKELTETAKQFADVKIVPPVPPPGAHTHHINLPPGSHVVMNGQMPGIGINLGLQEFNRTKRTRAVQEQQIRDFEHRLNNKIAALIRLRTQTKQQEDIDSLTISIDTLEMTRELLIEVFINQPNDE